MDLLKLASAPKLQGLIVHADAVNFVNISSLTLMPQIALRISIKAGGLEPSQARKLVDLGYTVSQDEKNEKNSWSIDNNLDMHWEVSSLLTSSCHLLCLFYLKAVNCSDIAYKCGKISAQSGATSLRCALEGYFGEKIAQLKELFCW